MREASTARAADAWPRSRHARRLPCGWGAPAGGPAGCAGAWPHGAGHPASGTDGCSAAAQPASAPSAGSSGRTDVVEAGCRAGPTRRRAASQIGGGSFSSRRWPTISTRSWRRGRWIAAGSARAGLQDDAGTWPAEGGQAAARSRSFRVTPADRPAPASAAPSDRWMSRYRSVPVRTTINGCRGCCCFQAAMEGGRAPGVQGDHGHRRWVLPGSASGPSQRSHSRGS
jgi:hypothetical protein